MNRRDFEQYLTKYEDVIYSIARKLGGANDDLVDDLQQVGRIALWHIDLRTVRTNQDAMIRNAIKYRMVDCLRSHERHKAESLDAIMTCGVQLEYDEEQESLRLLGARHSWESVWRGRNPVQDPRDTLDEE